jgi:DNA-binding transcriptional regulator YhcF (GntR family)
MKSKEITAIRKRIAKETLLLGKRRDSIREFIDELEALEQACMEAYESLEFADQALSRLT